MMVLKRLNAAPTNNPSVGGDAVSSFIVAPTLPTGLTLDASGRIAGTPSVAQARKSYTITAHNLGGQSSIAVTIEVLPREPSIDGYAL
jgi:hypothetical protein